LDDREGVGAFDVELVQVTSLSEIAFGEVGEFFDDEAPRGDCACGGRLALRGAAEGLGDGGGEVGGLA
jgi:hypothetical protein